MTLGSSLRFQWVQNSFLHTYNGANVIENQDTLVTERRMGFSVSGSNLTNTLVEVT